MLDCVYLPNKGCSLLPCVMGIITNIIQVCTYYFPSTCCKTGKQQEKWQAQKRNSRPPQTPSSLAAIWNVQLRSWPPILRGKGTIYQILWQVLVGRETETNKCSEEGQCSWIKNLKFRLPTHQWMSWQGCLGSRVPGRHGTPLIAHLDPKISQRSG